jgi:hypothetical protein
MARLTVARYTAKNQLVRPDRQIENPNCQSRKNGDGGGVTGALHGISSFATRSFDAARTDWIREKPDN